MGRVCKLKGGEYSFQQFYRVIYHNHVSLEMYLEEVVPIVKFFSYSISKDKLSEIYYDMAKLNKEIPMGEDLFRQWCLMICEDLVDMLSKDLEMDDKTDEIKGEKIVEAIFSNKTFDATLYPTVKEILDHVDRKDLALFIDEGLQHYRSKKLSEVVIDSGERKVPPVSP